MAKRKSMPRARRSPTRTRAKKRTNPACARPPARFARAVDDERMRLMKAHSVLGCLSLALDHYPETGTAGPYYPDVVDVARELVNEAISRLEVVCRPLPD